MHAQILTSRFPQDPSDARRRTQGRVEKCAHEAFRYHIAASKEEHAQKCTIIGTAKDGLASSSGYSGNSSDAYSPDGNGHGSGNGSKAASSSSAAGSAAASGSGRARGTADAVEARNRVWAHMKLGSEPIALALGQQGVLHAWSGQPPAGGSTPGSQRGPRSHSAGPVPGGRRSTTDEDSWRFSCKTIPQQGSNTPGSRRSSAAGASGSCRSSINGADGDNDAPDSPFAGSSAAVAVFTPKGTHAGNPEPRGKGAWVYSTNPGDGRLTMGLAIPGHRPSSAGQARDSISPSPSTSNNSSSTASSNQQYQFSGIAFKQQQQNAALPPRIPFRASASSPSPHVADAGGSASLERSTTGVAAPNSARDQAFIRGLSSNFHVYDVPANQQEPKQRPNQQRSARSASAQPAAIAQTQTESVRPGGTISPRLGGSIYAVC